MRAHTPTTADDTTLAPPSRGPTPAPSPGAAAMPTPPVGFDLGRIAIYPPAPQVGAAGGVLNPATASRIEARQGGGTPLAPTVQRRMEGALGHTLADVRIHADGETETLSRSLSARAFTLGNDVFLGREATSRGGTAGIACWRTSLTHVVQQRGVGERGPLTVGATDGAGEREADSVAAAVASGANRAPGGTVGEAGGARIQRQPDTADLGEMFDNYNKSQRPANASYLDTTEPTQDSRAAPAHPATHAPSPGGKENKAAAKHAPNLTELAQEVDLLKREQAVARNQRAATALDLRWRAKFGERMANYKQAVWRVTGAIDIAEKGFQDAQVAQSQTDQLTTQLIGFGVSILFAGTFEWIADAGLKALGAPPHLVQTTLGHASLATTSRYAHARPSDSSARYLAV